MWSTERYAPTSPKIISPSCLTEEQGTVKRGVRVTDAAMADQTTVVFYLITTAPSSVSGLPDRRCLAALPDLECERPAVQQ